MKKLFLGCLSLMFFTGTFCKDFDYYRLPDTDSIYKNAENKATFVFEGRILQQTFYWRGQVPVISEIIKIEKVFRGNLKLGTVELIYESSVITDVNYRDKVTNLVDTFGIFFCRVADEYPYNSNYNLDKTDNQLILSNFNTFRDLRPDRIIHTKYFGWVGMRFFPKNRVESKDIVYQYLHKIKNLKVPEHAEPEPQFIEPDPRYGPNATFKTKEEFDHYMDSVKIHHENELNKKYSK